MTEKEKRAAYQKKWINSQTPEKREKIRAQIREWYNLHRESQKERRKKHYLENRDYYLGMFKRRNKELKNDPLYRAKLQHKRKVYKARRRRKEFISVDFTERDWLYLIKSWDNKCAYCAEILILPTQDHIKPLSKGGEHKLDNILPSCMRCNQLKSTKDLGDFLLELFEILGGNPWTMPK